MTAFEMVATTFVLTLVVVLTRAGFLLFGERIALPDRLQRALRHAPLAALVAVLVPPLWAGLHGAQAGQTLARIAALVAAGLWFAWRRQMVPMIVLGMAVYTVLRQFC